MADEEHVVLCRSCKDPVLDREKVITCGLNCKDVYHIKCVDIKEPILKVLRDNKSLFWACPECQLAKHVGLVDALQRVSELTAKLDALQGIVNQHSDVIKNLDEKAKNKNLQKNGKPFVKSDSERILHDKNTNKDKNENSNAHKKPKNNAWEKNKDASQKLNSSPKIIENNDDFIEVKSRRKSDKRNASKITGTSSDATNCPLQAIAKRAHVHVWRLSKETTAETLQEYLTTRLHTKDVEVEALATRAEYASFRVSVDYDLMDSVYDPDIWPKHALVNRFTFIRNRKNLDEEKPKTPPI